jgi:hypothetical protein
MLSSCAPVDYYDGNCKDDSAFCAGILQRQGMFPSVAIWLPTNKRLGHAQTHLEKKYCHAFYYQCGCSEDLRDRAEEPEHDIPSFKYLDLYGDFGYSGDGDFQSEPR